MNEKQRQQGDVLILKLDELPEGAKEIKHGPVIVTGETTHKHQLSDIKNVRFYEKDGMFIFEVLKDAVQLNHEEHRTHTYEPGIYMWGQVQEKDWLTGLVRKVID